MADGTIFPIEADAVLLDDMNAGAVDESGVTVQKVLWDGGDFRIYRSADGIRPRFSDDKDEAKAQHIAYLDVADDIAAFNHLMNTLHPPSDTLSKKDAAERGIYEVDLARCAAQALTGQIEKATASLAILSCRVERRLANIARTVHLAINFAMVLCVWLIVLGLGYVGYESRFGFDMNHVGLAAIMGSLGAFFSTAVALRGLKIDPNVRRFMHFVHAGQRVLIGLLGAVVLYFGIKAGLLNGVLPFAPAGAATMGGAGASAGQINLHLLAFVSIIAGFSERFAPNILNGRAGEAKPDA